MAAHGYHRYEISNYARSGCECLHNKGYWTGTEYLGLGLGASSYTFFHRYHNTDDMEEYLSLDLSEAGAAVRDIQEISLEERMEEFMFLGLRMMEGVSGTDSVSYTHLGCNQYHSQYGNYPSLYQLWRNVSSVFDGGDGNGSKCIQSD